ncbi:MAG TPA: hypothetical protein VFV90_06425 [Usitatibacter sp.]|nr:hypothetical protein [Usitatibacter sp.]
MAALLVAGCGKLLPPAGASLPEWMEHPGNPIIAMGEQVKGMVWNDPTVIKEGDVYRMWLSGGDPSDMSRIKVEIYHATSSDGLKWKIDPQPVVRVGAPGTWDDLRIETPSVVKVGATYHLYYTGMNAEGVKNSTSSVGHATSTDGIHWTKDPVPVVVAQGDSQRWGFRGAGEPGAVYDPRTGTIYLYYLGMRMSADGKENGHIGVLLARSRDGRKFTHHVDDRGDRKPVLYRELDAFKGAWYGYMTPSALITSDGLFHIFASTYGPKVPKYDTLIHATSRDGMAFKVVEAPIFEHGRGDWKDEQVQSPAVIETPGRLEMWFAGESRKGGYKYSIGYASRKYP